MDSVTLPNAGVDSDFDHGIVDTGLGITLDLTPVVDSTVPTESVTELRAKLIAAEARDVAARDSKRATMRATLLASGTDSATVESMLALAFPQAGIIVRGATPVTSKRASGASVTDAKALTHPLTGRAAAIFPLCNGTLTWAEIAAKVDPMFTGRPITPSYARDWLSGSGSGQYGVVITYSDGTPDSVYRGRGGFERIGNRLVIATR